MGSTTGTAAPDLKPLSAVDSISPAFSQTKRQLFAPFRLQRWGRLAVVCLVIGDFAGGGGGPTNGFNYSPTHTRGGHGASPFGHPHWAEILPWLPWILAAVGLLILFILGWIYVASVYRFVLFDSVLYDRCELKGTWRRWERRGRSFFYWNLGLSAAVLAGEALIVGVPVALAWRAGVFRHPGEHLALLILGGGALLVIMIAFLVFTALIGLFAKDFCVPLMAIEEVGVLEAWRRLLPMIKPEKWAYALYVLMKIVLAMASAIIFGIITLMALVGVIIVVGIAGLILFFVGKAAGLTLNLATISIAAILGTLIVTGVFYLIALISTPAMVFFQSYTLHFFGSRYPALGAALFPPPENPAPPPPGALPEIEPLIG